MHFHHILLSVPSGLLVASIVFFKKVEYDAPDMRTDSGHVKNLTAHFSIPANPIQLIISTNGQGTNPI